MLAEWVTILVMAAGFAIAFVAALALTVYAVALLVVGVVRLAGLLLRRASGARPDATPRA